MTTAELECYVTKLLPSLRKKLLKTELDNDILQESLIAITEDHNKIVIHSDNEFIALVCRYFFRTVSCLNGRVRRNLAYGDYICDNLLIFGGSKLLSNTEELDNNEDGATGAIAEALISNPWINQRIEAIEYIEYVKDSHLQWVLYQHFVEGRTYEEIGELLDISKEAVRKQLNKGIDLIKAGILADS